VRVWRICRAAHRALDGEGARLYGGRWNAEGAPAVYTSASLALAALEYLVHIDPVDVPDDLLAMSLDVPDNAAALVVTVAQLPRGWRRLPDHPACVRIGVRWLAEGTALLLRVPSVVVPEETNVLINPGHPRAKDLRVVSTRPFAFDPRLL
jgi:RES domain-containing protein